MSTIFALLFFILLIVLVVGLSLLNAIVRFFAGLGRKTTGYGQQRKEPEQDTSASGYRHSASSGTKKKVFDDDEGEYVEFEEIKDSDTMR